MESTAQRCDAVVSCFEYQRIVVALVLLQKQQIARWIGSDVARVQHV